MPIGLTYFDYAARAFGGQKAVTCRDVTMDEVVTLQIFAAFGHVHGTSKKVFHHKRRGTVLLKRK